MSRGQVNSYILAQVESNRISLLWGTKKHPLKRPLDWTSVAPQRASVTTKLIRIPDEARDAPRLLSVCSRYRKRQKGRLSTEGLFSFVVLMAGTLLLSFFLLAIRRSV